MPTVDMADALMGAVLIAALIFLIWRIYGDSREYITSDVDGKAYPVVKHEDNESSYVEAADRLAEINAFIMDLIHRLKEKYPDSTTIPEERAVQLGQSSLGPVSDSSSALSESPSASSSSMQNRDQTTSQNNTPERIQSMQQFTKLLSERYDPSALEENYPLTTENTSYVNNKGQEIGFCIRANGKGAPFQKDPNLIKFVVMHEMSHLGTDEFGHTVTFWRNFKRLLQEATMWGLYVPTDYSKYPATYCRLRVTYNPMFDQNL